MQPKSPTKSRSEIFIKRLDLKITTEKSLQVRENDIQSQRCLSWENCDDFSSRMPKTCRQRLPSHRKACQDQAEAKTPSLQSNGHYLRSIKTAGLLKSSPSSLLVPLRARILTAPNVSPNARFSTSDTVRHHISPRNNIYEDKEQEVFPEMSSTTPHPAQGKETLQSSFPETCTTTPRSSAKPSRKLKLHDGIPSFYFSKPKLGLPGEGPVISTDGQQTDIFIPDPLDASRVRPSLEIPLYPKTQFSDFSFELLRSLSVFCFTQQVASKKYFAPRGFGTSHCKICGARCMRSIRYL